MQDRRFLIAVVIVTATVLTGAVGRTIPKTGSVSASELVVSDVPFPSGPGAGEPFLATAPDGRVFASWLEPGGGETTRFLFSEFDPVAVQWSEPSEIAAGQDWFVNWADVPSLAVGPDGRMAAHWLERLGSGRYAYGVKLVMSVDGGQSWEEPFWLHDDESATEHGFASLSFRDDGTLDAVWLDGRAMAMGGGAMAIRSRSISPDGDLSDEHLLDDRTCDCCPTTVARATDGSLLAAYRDRTENEVRDIVIRRMHDGQWGDSGVWTEDGWQIAACPVNGPSLSARGNALGMAWFTVVEGEPAVFGALTTVGSPDLENRVRLDAGNPTGRVSVAWLGDGEVAVSWIETNTESGGADLVTRIVSTDGTLTDIVVVAATSSSRAAGYPRMVNDGRGLVYLWTDLADDRTVRSAVVRAEG